MTVADRWRLPDGMDEVLPGRARQLEDLRRKLLDRFAVWGYELVVPPLAEYTDSLLLDVGHDVDLHAFKMTDQLSGRTMAVRPDITPQIARIDAHSLQRKGAVRLCYAGSVLHTRAKSPLVSRSPMQIGAELFGCEDLSADIEIISLMLDLVRHAGVENLHLDLGHVAIYRAIIAAADISADQQAALFDALQRKAAVEISSIIASAVTDSQVAGWLHALFRLNGDIDVLAEARAVLVGAPQAALDALDQLERVASTIRSRMPDIGLHFDLSELRGYHYHTGLVFGVLVPGFGEAVCNGGRYDDIGAAFGRSRAATGFSADLRILQQLSRVDLSSDRTPILAPNVADESLWLAVMQLRGEGEQVIVSLGECDVQQDCDRELVLGEAGWYVAPSRN